jgi:hypothetical protein
VLWSLVVVGVARRCHGIRLCDAAVRHEGC